MADQSLKSVSVDLLTSVLWFNKNISKVTLKEPSAADYLKIGEPEFFVGDGKKGMWTDAPERIEAYLEKCLDVEGSAVHFLTQLSMRDGRAIRKALMGFFREEPEAAPA